VFLMFFIFSVVLFGISIKEIFSKKKWGQGRRNGHEAIINNGNNTVLFKWKQLIFLIIWIYAFGATLIINILLILIMIRNLECRAVKNKTKPFSEFLMWWALITIWMVVISSLWTNGTNYTCTAFVTQILFSSLET
jgi:hypothetical protein